MTEKKRKKLPGPDLRFEAKLERARASLGEPVRVRLTITNSTEFPVVLPKDIGRFDDCCLIEGVKWSGGARLNVPAFPPARLPAVHFPRTPEFFAKIAPGKSAQVEHDLSEKFPEPGTYRFRVIYQGNSDFRPLVLSEPAQYAATPLESAWLELEIDRGPEKK